MCIRDRCNLKVQPSEMTWKIGLDCLTIGATKNGAFAAEAIIFFNKKNICNYKFFQKRSGHVIAKTKFISSQFIAWFQDNHWLKLAKKSNNIAKSFKNYLVQNKNFDILFPIDGNEVFVRVHELYYQEIMNKNVFPKLWSTRKNNFVILRFVFSFDFTNKVIAFGFCSTFLSLKPQFDKNKIKTKYKKNLLTKVYT